MPIGTYRYRLWLLLIILIALVLRFYNLTYHSLWFDEAISVYWARQDIPRILEVGFTLIEDRLPPLYYLMLKGWSSYLGFSEVGVRSLSVVFGLLLAPVAGSVAALLFNRRVALVTAALIALNPFLIWYAQEARMYAPAVFFSTLAVLALIKIVINYQLSIINYQHVLLFILAAIAALYSHLYAGFLLPALGLWLIISYPGHWKLWLMFGVSGLLISLAYAPILRAIWSFSAEAAPGDPLTGLSQRAWWLLQSFTVWKAPISSPLKTTIPFVFLLFAIPAYFTPIIQNPAKYPQTKPKTQNPKPKTQNPKLPGLLRAGKTQNSKLKTQNSKLLITLLLIFPFLIANLLLFRNHLAFFGERYFIVMLPWLLMLTAAGADNLYQWITQQLNARRSPPRTTHHVSGVTYQLSGITYHVSHITYHSSFIIRCSPFILLLIATSLPLPGQWSIPAAKEAWRQSVAYLAQQATADDGILIHPDWVRYPFQYYFEGPGQTYAAFSNVTAATSLDGPLQGVVGNHAVIWLVQSHVDGPDPERRVEQWLAARYPLATELYPPGVTLKGYVSRYQLDTLPPAVTPTDIQFENGLRLIGYQADEAVSATDDLFHPPSGWAHVTLYWTADRPVAVEATPYVHLVGPQGVWGASLERPNDTLKFFPPTQWPINSSSPVIIRQDLDVNLNPATPPGHYQLVVGLQGYGDPVLLTQIEVR
jgi:4-amino-4-deoxy-L-arabinose transferase-like glycosyltransferase